MVVHLGPSDNTLDNPYRLERQINISHSIIIQGDTFDQPFIDCFDAVRCFRVLVRGSCLVVWFEAPCPGPSDRPDCSSDPHTPPPPPQPGVYLTMRYVGINQGTGEYREAIPFFEGVPTTPTGLVSERGWGVDWSFCSWVCAGGEEMKGGEGEKGEMVC